MSARTVIERRRYGYWPSLEFMEAASAAFLYNGKPTGNTPFSDYQKSFAGKKDSWVILCTVNGANGPYEEVRTVTYGEWQPKGRVKRG